jgi:HK97 family phage portal protein
MSVLTDAFFYINFLKINMDILKKLGELDGIEKATDVGDLQSVYYSKIAPSTKETDYLNVSTGWVYACMNVIADEIAKIQLKLYQKKKDGVEEIFEHPVLDLLNKANNFTTKNDLFWLTTNFLEATGEAPWFVLKEGNVPTQIFLIRPDKLSVKAGTGDEFIDGYSYRNDEGKDIDIEADELIFIKYPNPTNPFRGQGTLQAASTIYDIEQYSETYNKNFFFNGASAGMVFKTEQKLTKDLRERLRKQIDQTHKGVSKAHKFMILEAGLDAKPLQASQRDMEFFNQLNWTRDKILGIFRVPRTALGITDDVNRANAEATDYVFSKRTIKPKMQRLVEQLNEFLLPMFPDGENLMLGFEDPVPEDLEAKLKVYDNGIKNKWLTPNEVREMEHLEPLEGGDEVVSAPTPAEKKKLKLIGHQINTRNKISARKAFVKDTKEKISKAVDSLKGDIRKMVVKEEVRRDKNVMRWSEDKKIENHELVLKRASRNEMRYRNAVEKQFEGQEKRILQGKEKAILQKDWKIDVDTERQIWFRILLPIMTDIVRDEGQAVMNSITSGLIFDSHTEIIRNFIDNRTMKISKEVNEQTNRTIAKILKDNPDANEVEIGRKISKKFGNMKRYRSKLIARTETFKAVNFATDKSYEQSGVVEAKEWFTAMDERVCPYCGPMNGKTIGVGKTWFKQGETIRGDDGSDFIADFESISNPPLHANCRCGLVPVLVGAKKFKSILKAKFMSQKVDKEIAIAEHKEIIEKATKESNKDMKDLVAKVDKIDKKVEGVEKKTDEKLGKIADNVKEALDE